MGSPFLIAVRAKAVITALRRGASTLLGERSRRLRIAGNRYRFAHPVRWSEEIRRWDCKRYVALACLR